MLLVAGTVSAGLDLVLARPGGAARRRDSRPASHMRFIGGPPVLVKSDLGRNRDHLKPSTVTARTIGAVRSRRVRVQVQGSEPAWSLRVWRTWRSFVLYLVWT